MHDSPSACPTTLPHAPQGLATLVPEFRLHQVRTLIYFPLYFSQLLIYFLLWWSELVTSVFEVSGAVMAFMSRNGRVSGLRLRA